MANTNNEVKRDADYFVEKRNEMVSHFTEVMVPLVTGTIVDKETIDKQRFSDYCHKLNEMATAIRAAHDEWVKLEIEADENVVLHHIRKPRNSEDKGKGFLKL